MAKKDIIKKGKWKEPAADKYTTAAQAVAELNKSPEPSELEKLSLGELIRQIVQTEIKVYKIDHNRYLAKDENKRKMTIYEEQIKLNEMYEILSRRESRYGPEPRFS